MKLEEGLMISNLASALVIAALGTGVASAQTATTRTDAAAPAAAHREGEWRASKLVGVDVYNEANEKIGDISEIILDKSGKVANVIIGVGGFLGMGEHYVAVGYDKLKWVNEPARSASAASDRPAADPATRPTAVKRVLIHGVNDDIVPVEMSRDYPLPARIVQLPGADHFAVIDPSSAAWPEVISEIRALS